jgi:hypothetical protein
MSVCTYHNGISHIWTNADIQEAYDFLNKSTPRQIASIMNDWQSVIDNGSTDLVTAEAMGMLTVIGQFLYAHTSSRVAESVTRELLALSRYDICCKWDWMQETAKSIMTEDERREQIANTPASQFVAYQG